MQQRHLTQKPHIQPASEVGTMSLDGRSTPPHLHESQDGFSDSFPHSRQLNKPTYNGPERRKGADSRSGMDAQIGRSIRVRFGSKYIYVPKSMDRRSGIDRRKSHRAHAIWL